MKKINIHNFKRRNKMKTIDIILTGVGFLIINFIVWASLIYGGIYFILWALKHFNIIG